MRNTILVAMILALSALGCSKDTGTTGSNGSSAATNAGGGASGSNGSASAASTGTNGSNGSSGSTSSGSSSGSSGSSASSGSGGSSSGSGSGGTTSTDLDAGRAAYCAGTGAPVDVGDSSLDGGFSSSCAGNLAQRTFRFALCTCDALTVNQHLDVDSFVMVDAGFPDGGSGLVALTGRNNGSVGVNAGITTESNNAQLNVKGSLYDSDGGITARGAIAVAGELHLGSIGAATAASTVGRDAYCASNITGSWTIDGNLYQPSTALHTGVSVRGDAGVVAASVNVPDPCDCTDLVDIAGIVASHQANNDNASLPPPDDGGTTVQFGDGGEGLLLPDGGYQQIALDPATWASGAGPTTYTWPCGRYFLSAVQITTATTWNISGRTALLVDGDFDVRGGGITINVPPGSELDLFVGGNFSVAATSSFGSGDNVSGTRIYIGGSQDICLTTPVNIDANIYAPFAQFGSTNPLTIYGALFARAFVNNCGGASGGNTTIHYDEDVLSAGTECLPPPPPPDAGAPVDAGAASDAGAPVDAGTPVDAGPPGCLTCSDCNNQACNIPDGGTAGTCGACTTSADCCAPLVCTNGTCQILFQ